MFLLSRSGGTCLPAGRLVGAHDLQIKYGGRVFVYVLSSLPRNYVYIGLTDNISRRFFQHQTGKNKTTAPYRPFSLVHTENFQTRIEARVREKYLKSGSGKEWIKKNILKNK